MIRFTVDVGWKARWRTVLAKLVIIQDQPEVDGFLTDICHRSDVRILAFVNAHAMNGVATSAEFFTDVSGADLLVRDGSGMAALLTMLARPAGWNLNGTDLIPWIIERYNGRRIALFGTREPYLRRAVAKTREQLSPKSELYSADGYRDMATYLSLVQEHRPELIVLGMGMPKQEAVALFLRGHVSSPCLIVCGGAIIDFLGNKTTRAPRLMRRIGLEWLFRLTKEPRRLFFRYVVGNPLFLVRALRFTLARNGREPD